jgi:hypothetical protein
MIHQVFRAVQNIMGYLPINTYQLLSKPHEHAGDRCPQRAVSDFDGQPSQLCEAPVNIGIMLAQLACCHSPLIRRICHAVPGQGML